MNGMSNMGFLIYFIGYIIAMIIIIFVMNDDWRTEGVTLSDWIANSIFGSLSWALVIGFLLLYIICMMVSIINSLNMPTIYLLRPKK